MPQKKARPDCDRRARQSERLGRLLHLLRLLASRGRYGIAELSAELECSSRTVYRLLDALTSCGIPWYLDRKLDSYRIRDGFKLGALGEVKTKSEQQKELLEKLEQLADEGRKLAETLNNFLVEIENLRGSAK